MARIKADIRIGQRCWEEYQRMTDGSPRHGEQWWQIPHSTAYNWSHGACPSVRHLAVLGRHGADLNYILTGRRTEC